jgi:hypothetical protein
MGRSLYCHFYLACWIVIVGIRRRLDIPHIDDFSRERFRIGAVVFGGECVHDSDMGRRKEKGGPCARRCRQESRVSDGPPKKIMPHVPHPTEPADNHFRIVIYQAVRSPRQCYVPV